MADLSRKQMGAIADVVCEVIEERKRQHAKWGEQDLPSFGTDAPSEEQLLDLSMARKYASLAAQGHFPLSFHSILFEEYLEAITERDPARLRAELIQVAAVAVQWIEKLDREASHG